MIFGIGFISYAASRAHPLKARELLFSLLTLAAIFIPLETVVAAVVGADNRRSIEKYAQIHGADVEELRKLYGATGRIMCPFGEARAFLVHKANFVVTARHNLFAEKEMKGYSAKPSILRCGFEVTNGKTST